MLARLRDFLSNTETRIVRPPEPRLVPVKVIYRNTGTSLRDLLLMAVVGYGIGRLWNWSRPAETPAPRETGQ